jgi:hypothetical protein
MSNRNNVRVPRIPILTENDRIILNIYLNMYNQTVRDIDLLYENLSSIRNIIDHITGVTVTTPQQQQEEEEPINLFSAPAYHRSNSFYTNNTLSNRFYLLSLARNILENYDETYADVAANRTAGVRTRNRVNTRIPTSLFRNSRANGLSDTFFPNLNSFYDNVPIYPTTEQFLNGTRRIVYSDMEEEPLNSSCPITLERFESDSEVLQILGCKHIFNPTSLQHWFHSNVRCPVCRYDIREYNPHNRRSRYFSNTYDDEEETKEDDTVLHSTATSETSASSDSTLHTSPESPEPQSRNTIPEPTDNTEFITNLTSVTENMLNDLFSASFPNTQFNFNGTTYSVDLSNNEIVFQGYIHPNDGEL